MKHFKDLIIESLDELELQGKFKAPKDSFLHDFSYTHKNKLYFIFQFHITDTMHSTDGISSIDIYDVNSTKHLFYLDFYYSADILDYNYNSSETKSIKISQINKYFNLSEDEQFQYSTQISESDLNAMHIAYYAMKKVYVP